MSKKIGKSFNLSILIIVIVGIFVFGVNLYFAQNNIINKKTPVKSIEINNENLDKKLLEVVNIKLDVANEKEAAYEKAINQLKLYASFWGIILIAIVTFFGIWKNKEIREAKDELLERIEDKKKSLEENNSINMERKMLELEKNNNVRLDKIKEFSFGDIKDLQDRIKKLELGNKIDLEDKNTWKNNKEEVSFEEKNPYE